MQPVYCNVCNYCLTHATPRTPLISDIQNRGVMSNEITVHCNMTISDRPTCAYVQNLMLLLSTQLNFNFNNTETLVTFSRCY